MAANLLLLTTKLLLTPEILVRKPDRKKKTPFCYFSVPDDDNTHSKIEVFEKFPLGSYTYYVIIKNISNSYGYVHT